VYYFIFEPAANRKIEKIEEEIKARASELQIDGEFITLSLAEQPESLAKIGLQKDYHTIIAVGSDALINSVAQGLINQEAALGAIPLEEDSIFLSLIGVPDWQEALEILPARKIELLDSVLLNRRYRFATQVEIMPPPGKKGVIVLAFDAYFRAEVTERRIIVSNLGVKLFNKTKVLSAAKDGYLDVFIPGKTELQKKWWQVFSQLTSEETESGSTFHPKFLEINSKLKLRALINKKVVANSPFLFEIEPRTLSFIVKRSKSEEFDDQNSSPATTNHSVGRAEFIK